MIIFLFFINLFAPCSADVTYYKILNVTENNEQTTYHSFVKGHMNIDDVIYDKLYINKIVWYLEDEITLKITTMDGEEYDCEAWTVMLTEKHLGKEIRNCLCSRSGFYYFLEKYSKHSSENRIYR